ncbi:MAG: arsenical pump membrane protein [Candidatus Nanohaloarchaea archaeon]|jgi:arsenical pump membrane protein
MLESFLVSAFFLTAVVSIFVNQKVIEFRGSRFLDIPYYISPFAAAFALVLTGVIDLNQVYTALTGISFSQGLAFLNNSGPFSAILLFLSVAFVSLCLEVSGFFRYLAVKVLEKVDGSGRKLFFAVFWISGFLALFTSNDILILTFTPFLIEFLRFTDLEAVPFLVAEFFAANVFSMVFLIGNETNIIVATSQGLGFLNFIEVMVIPGLAGGLACFISLYWVFRSRIPESYSCRELPDLKIDRWEVLSSSLLLGTLLSLAVFSVYGFLLWHIVLVWVLISLVLFVLPDTFEKVLQKKDAEELFIYRINQKMPWEVVPFLIGFFVLVHASMVTGLTSGAQGLIEVLAGEDLLKTVFGVGVASTLSANLLNNIPMTALFSEVLTGYGAGATRLGALYALVIGSNIGAIVTPIGALAGIMWMKMVNHDGEKITFRGFFSIGWKIAIPTLLASLLGLYLSITFVL